VVRKNNKTSSGLSEESDSPSPKGTTTRMKTIASRPVDGAQPLAH